MTHDPPHAHGQSSAGKLKERRLVAEPTVLANIQALVGGLGVTALGAATYATWAHDTPMPIGTYLLGAGTLGVIVAWLMGSSDSTPIRVGDAGVAVEHGGGQPDRIAWYEIEKVSLEGRDRVVVEGAKKRIVAPTAHHGAAAGWIVKEALERIPARVALSPEHSAGLVAAADDHAPILAVEPMQVAGRRCKASNVVISFERDARVCKRCGEAYERKHVPEKCLTCDASMATSAPVLEARE